MLLDELEIIKEYLDKKSNKTMILSAEDLLFYISVENLVNEYENLERRDKVNEDLIEKMLKFIAK